MSKTATILAGIISVASFSAAWALLYAVGWRICLGLLLLHFGERIGALVVAEWEK